MRAILLMISITAGAALAIPCAAPCADPEEVAASSWGHAVKYFPADDVSAAFAKGAVLVDAGGYMVHASRREGAGQAEIHLKDTDIIYVLDGTATFVTGGSVPDQMTTAADEIRGSTIVGGETRRLAKGDIIIVPNGTPHWFQVVPGPLTYYVVKVR